MAPSSLPSLHHHNNALDTLIPLLLQYQPYSFPLLRRLRFTSSSPHAHVLSTAPLDQAVSSCPNAPFSVAYVDRSRAPETECWLFCSLESNLPASISLDEVKGNDIARLARHHILTVLHGIALLPTPTDGSTTEPSNPTLILGSLNECLLPILAGNDINTVKSSEVLSRSSPSTAATTTTTTAEDAEWANILTGTSVPYIKYLIPPPPPPPPSSGGKDGARTDVGRATLPAGYTFTPSVPTSDLPLVVASTKIPRSIPTLASLGSVGVRVRVRSRSLLVLPPSPPPPSNASPRSGQDGEEEDADERRQELGEGEVGQGDLVAWAFLSSDGSLSSLHVQPAHRGKGVAKAVCRRLCERLRDEGAGMGFAALPAGVAAAAESAARVSEGNGGVEMEAKGGKEGEGWEGMRRGLSEGWLSSDVAEDNVGSQGVLRAVGAIEGWKIRWVGVDLECVRRVFEAVRGS